jgi:hypothetical protein
MAACGNLELGPEWNHQLDSGGIHLVTPRLKAQPGSRRPRLALRPDHVLIEKILQKLANIVAQIGVRNFVRTKKRSHGTDRIVVGGRCGKSLKNKSTHTIESKPGIRGQIYTDSLALDYAKEYMRLMNETPIRLHGLTRARG